MSEKILHVFLGNELGGAFPTLMHALTQPKINRSLAPRAGALADVLIAKLSRPSTDVCDCIRAAMYLLADDLDTAHGLCQNVPTPLGSALHAHLHRREGDFSNSHYWWRRASRLAWQLPEGPLAPQVAAALGTEPAGARWREKLGRGTYDPGDLVDAVEGLSNDEGAWADSLRAVQRLEWLSLVHACCS